MFGACIKAAGALDHNNECCARCGFNQEVLSPTQLAEAATQLRTLQAIRKKPGK